MRVKLLLALIGAFAVTVTAALCGLFWVVVLRPSPPPQRYEASRVPTADQLREIEGATHLTFPASTRILIWHTEGRMDAYLQMKVEMAAGDWPAFIAASPFRDQPLVEGARADLRVDDGTWAPGKVAHLLEGQVWLPGAQALNLGADLSRPGVVVVYVVWYET